MKKIHALVMTLFAAVALIGVFASCGGDEEDEIFFMDPYTKTLAATEVNEHQAVMNGRIITEGLEEVGFFYSTDKKDVQTGGGRQIVVEMPQSGTNFSYKMACQPENHFYYVSYGKKNGQIIVDGEGVQEFTNPAYGKDFMVKLGPIEPSFCQVHIYIISNCKASQYQLGIQVAREDKAIEEGERSVQNVRGNGDQLIQSLNVGPLDLEQKYLIRAFVLDPNSGEYSYSETKTFTTLPVTSGDYVDMGQNLGVWASCNIGAKNPWETGDYFAFGELDTKEEFNEDNYSLDFSQMPSKIQGTQYDVATAKLGNGWVIPTSANYNKLQANCDVYTGVKWHDVRGEVYVSKETNNALFFTPTGYMDGSSKVKSSSRFYRTCDKDDHLRQVSQPGSGMKPYYGGVVRAIRK